MGLDNLPLAWLFCHPQYSQLPLAYYKLGISPRVKEKREYKWGSTKPGYDWVSGQNPRFHVFSRDKREFVANQIKHMERMHSAFAVVEG